MKFIFDNEEQAILNQYLDHVDAKFKELGDRLDSLEKISATILKTLQSSTAPAPTPVPDPKPLPVIKAPYDLAPFKLTLPVNAAGEFTGAAKEIYQPELLTYSGPFFLRNDNDNTFSFLCPDGGAVTSSAKYPRSELRHLTNYLPTQEAEDSVDFAVETIPDGYKTVVHQIHGFGNDDDPWVKVVYTGKDNGTGILRAIIQPRKDPNHPENPVITVTLKQNIKNGDRTKSKIKVTQEGGVTFLSLFIDGSDTPTVILSQDKANDLIGKPCKIQMLREDRYYFKKGNYFQSIDRKGQVCKVVHYGS